MGTTRGSARAIRPVGIRRHRLRERPAQTTGGGKPACRRRRPLLLYPSCGAPQRNANTAAQRPDGHAVATGFAHASERRAIACLLPGRRGRAAVDAARPCDYV